MLVADFSFIDAFWSMFVFFIWIFWLWLLIMIWTDIFRRDDFTGWVKALWLVFTILVPILGALIYLVTQGEEMTKRGFGRAGRHRQEYAEYVQETAGGGGGAAEIARGKELLDRGVITQDEFDVLKTNALDLGYGAWPPRHPFWPASSRDRSGATSRR